MTATPNSPPTDPRDPPSDWVDEILLRDAGDYIADQGFTARVMQELPLAGALPTWRRPAIVALWALAGVFLAVALPGVAVDVAREAYKLFAARPFSLSTIAFMVASLGAASWTAAAVALRRD